MYDRALQALVKMALEAEWEAKFEPNSYVFRPGRSCHDAIEAIFKAIKCKSKFVLDADIAKCFDRINHEKLLTKVNTFPALWLGNMGLELKPSKKRTGDENWVFATPREGKNPLKLYYHRETKIQRHIKVKGNASPCTNNDKSRSTEERCEGKLSRTVLESSGGGDLFTDFNPSGHFPILLIIDVKGLNHL